MQPQTAAILKVLRDRSCKLYFDILSEIDDHSHCPALLLKLIMALEQQGGWCQQDVCRSADHRKQQTPLTKCLDRQEIDQTGMCIIRDYQQGGTKKEIQGNLMSDPRKHRSSITRWRTNNLGQLTALCVVRLAYYLTAHARFSHFIVKNRS